MPELNIQLHCLGLGAAYRRTEGEPGFAEVPGPTGEALQALLRKIIAGLMKQLTGRRVPVEEKGATCLADCEAESDDARTVWPCRARRTGGPAPRQAQPVRLTVSAWARPSVLASARGPERRCSRPADSYVSRQHTSLH